MNRLCGVLLGAIATVLVGASCGLAATAAAAPGARTGLGPIPAPSWSSPAGWRSDASRVAAPPADTTPPTITITSPTEGQHIALNAAVLGAYSCDDPGGSGVATCMATGPVDSTTPGPHGFTVDATDVAGNSSTKTVHFVVDPDVTPPTITITSPTDGQHYASGATIHADYGCDDAGGSGVATCVATTAIDTSVGTHAFTVDATDNAGNANSKTVHYTVDPLVDTTPPTITITTPTEGQHVELDAVINAMYACDDPGGSGVATCVAEGPLDTATPGSHAFTVNATDVAGNSSTKTVHYIVDPDTTPPTITITSPADGQHFAFGATIHATFACGDTGGSGVDTCAATTAIDTSVGTHDFTVAATDHVGNSSTKTNVYTVDAAVDSTPPTITITSPTEGQHVVLNSALTSDFSCADTGGSGVATCAPVAPLDTSTAGTHEFTIAATDVAGNAASKTVHYIVDPDTTPPTITITSPVDGQHYAIGATIPDTFSCDDAGGSGANTCVAEAAVDTSVGAHAFTVDATDHAGNAASKTVHYTVDPDTTAPTITITSPVDGQHYAPGVAIPGTFSCDDAGGSGLATCEAATALDASPGAHVFTVNATDHAGNPATKSVTYIVDATPGAVQPPGGTIPVVPIAKVASAPVVVAASRASVAALARGVTLSLSSLKPRSQVEVRVRRGARTISIFKTTAGATGKVKLKIKLSRKQLKTLRGKTLTLRYATTAANGKKKVVTKKLKVF